MDLHDLTRDLQVKNDSKIVMLVADGLGGLPLQPGGKTELESAATPHLDALAARGAQGGSIPVLPGISPGSGPGHLALFGYDPLRYLIGRGALEATGIGFLLEDGDVAVRCNFCSLDADGNITDRRARRIPSEASFPLVDMLDTIRLSSGEVFVRPVKEHRFVVVFRDAGLGGYVDDTDPQRTGIPPQPPAASAASDATSQKTAALAAEFAEKARQLLADQPVANGLTMRGFAARPALPCFEEVYGLRAAAIAVYPMYKGLASLVGMEIIGEPKTLEEQIDLLAEHWNDYDFFFIHFKYTDSTGEDGNFAEKVARIEQLDRVIPRLNALDPQVTIVTGDHSTPAGLSAHSWHAVPTLLVSDCCRTDGHTTFGESSCRTGELGQFEAKYLMSLAMSNAKRMSKFGA